MTGKSHTESLTILDLETNETQRQDFVTHNKGFQDFEIGLKVSKTQHFYMQVPFAPSYTECKHK